MAEVPRVFALRPAGMYLEDQGDLVSRFILGIIGVTIWFIGVINLLPKSP